MKSLKETNKYLQDEKTANEMILKSVVSSSEVEGINVNPLDKVK